MADFLFSDGPIRALQELLSPALDGLFLVLTTAGNGALLVALSIIVYWVWDKRLGLVLGGLVLFGAALNGFLKAAFGLPRPPAELHLTQETGNGFPSGHSQYAASFWSNVAFASRGAWALAASTLIVLVALSRVYLGVHYIGDVLGGVGIGLALVLGGWLIQKSGALDRMGLRAKLVAAILLPSAFFGSLWLLRQDVLQIWGFFTGFAVGYVLEGEWVGLKRGGDAKRVGLRLIVGAPVLVVLYIPGLLSTFPPVVLAYSAVFGLVATLLLPWLFLRVEARVLGADVAGED